MIFSPPPKQSANHTGHRLIWRTVTDRTNCSSGPPANITCPAETHHGVSNAVKKLRPSTYGSMDCNEKCFAFVKIPAIFSDLAFLAASAVWIYYRQPKTFALLFLWFPFSLSLSLSLSLSRYFSLTIFFLPHFSLSLSLSLTHTHIHITHRHIYNRNSHVCTVAHKWVHP